MKSKFPMFKIALSLVLVLALASCGSTAKKPNNTEPVVNNKVDVDNGKNNGINLELNGTLNITLHIKIY